MAQDKAEFGATPSDDVPSISFTQLFRYSTPFELFIDAIGIAAAVATGVSSPLMTLIFGNLIQAFVSFGAARESYSNADDITTIEGLNSAGVQLRKSAALDASYLVYIGIGVLVCTYVYMIVWVYTGEVNAKRIREKYLESILHQDVTYFDTVGAGEVATRIQTDTHLVQQGISEKVALVVNYVSAFVAGFALAYARCWRLALAMSAILPCIAITGATMKLFISNFMQRSLKHVSEGGTIAEEVISTIRTTHAFGTQKVFGDLYDKHIQISGAVGAKAALINGAGTGAFSFFIFAAYALAFQFGTTLVNEGHANAGQITNVILAILIGSFSLVALAPELQVLFHGQAAAAKLFATIERVPRINSIDSGGLKPEKVVGEIILEDIKFTYPSRPDVPILKGIDISFNAGQTAALVGASGSGKSTIIALIERFYDPSNGSVKLDGVDIRSLNIKWLRSQIGLVSQEPTLFATTIRDNVAHGLINTSFEHHSEEEKFRLIKDACVKANADSFISKLPNGYDTMVGERGFLLSGGQKQRIAIARAIVSDPRILLLDEATSALDTQSEGIVQDALERAAAGRTTITIAHRLSTIKDADCIYVMGDGVVLEKGTHAELLVDENSAYSRLVHAQKIREASESVDDTSIPITSDEEVTKEIIAEEAVPLGRKETIHSAVSIHSQTENDEKDPSGNEDKRSTPYLFMRIALLNREELWRYAIGTVFAIMSGTTFPVMGIVFGLSLSGFSEPDPAIRRHDGNRNALWFFVIALLTGLSNCLQNYLFASSASILTYKIRSLGFRTILRQDIEFFDKDENDTGALTGNLSDNPQKISGLAGVTLGVIVQGLATLVGGSTIGLIYAYKLALVGIATIPAVLSTGYVRLRVVILKDEQNKNAHRSSAQLACEAVASIRTIASLTREEDCLRLYSQSLEEPLRNSNKMAAWTSLLYGLSQSMPYYVLAIVFWYGSSLISRLEFSTLSFFVCLMSLTFAAMQTGNMFSYAPDISSARSAAAEIVQLIDTTPLIGVESDSGQMIQRGQVRGQIQLENVHFRYPTRRAVRVLQGLSLKIEPGTYVALVGASGCGKSTVIQLIERFYDPLAGRVLLDGNPINSYNIQEYRKQIALVSQEPTLYAGTIRFNVLLGATKPQSEITQEEIEAACRNANILDFIQSLPDGFDTQVGGKGSQLSGGQKQRIAIARALLRDPRVLLLDEATSALDSNSEKVVQAALDQAAKGRTTIAIAHRLSTIQNADCIYFIKEGRVSEAGTHNELLSLRGDYFEYVQLQALNKK